MRISFIYLYFSLFHRKSQENLLQFLPEVNHKNTRILLAFLLLMYYNFCVAYIIVETSKGDKI